MNKYDSDDIILNTYSNIISMNIPYRVHSDKIAPGYGENKEKLRVVCAGRGNFCEVTSDQNIYHQPCLKYRYIYAHGFIYPSPVYSEVFNYLGVFSLKQSMDRAVTNVLRNFERLRGKVGLYE